jgi:hypothetical protein
MTELIKILPLVGFLFLAGCGSTGPINVLGGCLLTGEMARLEEPLPPLPVKKYTLTEIKTELIKTRGDDQRLRTKLNSVVNHVQGDC